MNEKISFLFPFTRYGKVGENFSPVLTYECESLPVKVSFDVAFYFICLKNDEVYKLLFDILKDGESLTDDTLDRKKDFKAEDPESAPDQIAVGLNINISSLPFESEGIYTIVAKLFSTSSPVEPLDVKEAFFKVKKKSD